MFSFIFLYILYSSIYTRASLVAQMAKNLPVSARVIRDLSSLSELGRFPGENGNPLHYSSLENSMDRGTWWATVYGVTKRQTRLSPCAQIRWWREGSWLWQVSSFVIGFSLAACELSGWGTRA